MSLKEWFGKGSKGDWVDIGAPKKRASSNPAVVNLQKLVKGNIQSAYQGLLQRA